jgi:hypothetical protein
LVQSVQPGIIKVDNKNADISADQASALKIVGLAVDGEAGED